MKRLIAQLALLIAVLSASVQAHAYDCVVNGIYYNLNSSNNTAEVTSGEYEGAIAIPESITCNGSSYSVTSIGDFAFYACSGLMSMTIPNSVTSIGDYAFRFCTGLTSVTIGNSVASIGDYAFESCTVLTSVTIPESVTSIGEGAFYYCTALTSVTIPESVTSISEGAFYYCSGLKRLTCLAPNPPTCGDSAFNGVDRTRCTLYVLEESVNVYKIADQWKDFYNVVGLLGVDDITVDGDDAETLYDVYNMQGVKVGGGLRRADMSDALPHGIYILVSPNATRKIRL